MDLLPPQHFIQVLAHSDRALARSLLKQDRSFFEDPVVSEILRDRFAEYQRDLNRDYQSWFIDGGDSPIPAWRYAGYPGGLLAVLERTCRERSVPLRRVDQDWMQWQLRFFYEYAWQQSLDSLRRNDYAKFVQFIFEHHAALSRHRQMVENQTRRVRASLLRNATDANAGHVGFVYVQESAFTALGSYAACRDLGQDSTLEAGVRIGTVYVVEELLRRAYLAKNRDPEKALAFARSVVAQCDADHIVAWWSPQMNTRPPDILRSLSEDGFFDADEIEVDGLLLWNEEEF
jgi:hypothetical protein